MKSPCQSLNRKNSNILWQKFEVPHFTQKCKNVITGDHEKDTCLQYEGWNRKAGHWKWSCLIRLQLGTSEPSNSYYSSPFVCTCLWMIVKVPPVLILDLQIDFSKGANMQSAKYEDQLYLSLRGSDY